MADGLKHSMFALSAILPVERVDAAATELIHAYMAAPVTPGDVLIWGDFVERQFVRGGASSLHGATTRMFPAARDSPELQALVDHFPAEDVVAGHVKLSADGSVLYWYVPSATVSATKAPSQFIRGFVVDQPLFAQVLAIFARDAGLTKAEKRAIFGLVGGMSLADSATADGVSVETKRTQIKQSCAKLQCRGQSQLVRLVVGQLTHLISVSSAESSSVEVAEWFAQRYLPPDARLVVVRLGNGRLMRYFDSGPPNAQPVVFSYAIPYPNSLVNALPHLQNHNLRVITPLRPGYLEPDVFSDAPAELLEFRAPDDDIVELMQLLFDAPVPLVCSSTATVSCIRMVDCHPDLFSHLICLSPIFGTLGGEVSKDLGTFFKAIFDAVQSDGSIVTLSRTMRSYNTDPEILGEVMLNLYGEIESDVAALTHRVNGHSVIEALADAYKFSFVGITGDFMRAAAPWEGAFAKVQIPIHIIHGSADSAVSASILQYLRALNNRVHVTQVESGGHFFGSTEVDASAMWGLISAAVAQED